jgi:hypothetical protein
MRNLTIKFIVGFLLGTALVAESQALPPLPKPNVIVNLAKLGWRASPLESDKSFFRTFSIEKLEAIDIGAENIVFLNDDVLVAFHTVQESQEGKDWRTVRRELEAFFLRAEDGTLLFKQRWLTSPRKDWHDLHESEARLIRISDDRFLVHANGTLMLYASDLRLLKEKKLVPAGWNDVWGAQSIRGGGYILLRHGTRSRPYARYEWLDSDTLEAKYRIESYSLAGPVGTEDSIIGNSDSGIKQVDLNQRATAICQNQPCPKDGALAVLSSHRIVFLQETRVGVIDTDHGLVWADSIDPKYVSASRWGLGLALRYLFLNLSSAASGERFAFSVTAVKKTYFHGEKIGGSPVIFIYDAESQIPIYVLRTDGMVDYTFSPDGGKFAVLDRSCLRIYSIN